MTEIEPLNAYFEIFRIHQKITREDSRSLDDFLTWAPVMLSDFNDIDLYLANAEEVFSSLSEARALQEWNLSSKPLTKLQTNYLQFYNSLFKYYKDLKTNLFAENLGYKGMIYRHLFENIQAISANWHWNRFILVGFNALSKSEKDIFKYIKNNYTTDVLVDVDSYYFDQPNSKGSESGRFVRELVKEWGIEEIKWQTDTLATQGKKITISGIPKNIWLYPKRDTSTFLIISKGLTTTSCLFTL